MQLTDEKILAHLKARQEKLKLEAELVETAIKIFEDTAPGPIDMPGSLPGLVEPAGANADFANALLTYNPKDKVEHKIIFILRKIGHGDVDEIVGYLLRIDHHIKDIKRVYSRVNHVANKMLMNGVITADAIGMKTVYKLI